MKNIESHVLEKYATEQYLEIAFSVFKSKSANNYCFTFEAEFEENEEQYPLEDLLSQYSLNCTDHYVTDHIIDGKKKSIIEVETLSDKKNDLINILNFSTIIGRTVENVVFGGSVLLVLKYGIGKIKFTSREVAVPIFAYRNDRAGMRNFEIIHPEMQYKKMFEEGVDIKDLMPAHGELKFVLLKDAKAFVIFEEDNQMHRLVYGLKGYEQMEKVEDVH